MKRKQLLMLSCVLAFAALAFAHRPAPAPDHTATQANQPGYRVHIDPATGAIATDPDAARSAIVLDRDVENALSSSSKGLREVPNPVSGGGVMVDLQGRFQNTSVATIDEDGALSAPCISGLPEPTDDTSTDPATAE